MLFGRFFSSMPPVVDGSIEELLTRLEGVLREKAPAVAAALQPGLTVEAVSGLEERLGFGLSDEIRALYRWRNGMGTGGARDFIPGHRFLPLDEAVADHMAAKRQLASAPLLQRAAFGMVAGHRRDWLTVLDDGAGDGYFFDPKRVQAGVAILYHFAEDGAYRFFPSVKNLLAGTTEAFERGVYRPGGEGFLGEDYLASERLWERFGAAYPPR